MAKQMRVGELRHAVKILHKSVSGQDGHGQPVASWPVVDCVFAKVEPLLGRQIEYARQLYHLASHRVTMRYTPKLTTTSRIQFGERVFHVGHINDLEERQIWLEALCSEGSDKNA